MGEGAVVEVNGRAYAVPGSAGAVICLDGADPAYLAAARSRMPVLASWPFEVAARGAMPSFTNPNNVSIVTGVVPAVHGISGNHYFDPARGAEVQMTSRAEVRCGTVLEALAPRVPVAVVTAKKKLTALIGAGEVVSAEAAPAWAVAMVGRAPGDIYSADASLWVLDLGVALLRSGRARLVYLSTTDYVQHKHGPSSADAIAFHAAVDERLGALVAAGARVVLTADHGMNDKPDIVWLEPVVGAGAKVTLPITDPYVVHHGALGSCAMVHAPAGLLGGIARALSATPGVEDVLGREEAARALELPADRIGDLVVLASRSAVLGKSPASHDLSALGGHLRSHGGLHERAVPLASSHAPVIAAPREGWRNLDAFSALLGAGG